MKSLHSYDFLKFNTWTTHWYLGPRSKIVTSEQKASIFVFYFIFSKQLLALTWQQCQTVQERSIFVQPVKKGVVFGEMIYNVSYTYSWNMCSIVCIYFTTTHTFIKCQSLILLNYFSTSLGSYMNVI